MAEPRENEKDNLQETSPCSQALSKRKDVLEDGEKPSSRPRTSHSTSSSHSSIDSNPLSPLERSLTPNLFTESEQLGEPNLTYTRTATSFATTGSRIPSFEIDFNDNDGDDPRTWPLWYRGLMIFTVSFSTWVVVLFSTSYTSGMPGMMKEFGIKSNTVATLGVTMYLIGISAGSLILAPVSEIYGRRPVYIGSLLVFCAMILPCALAKSLAEVIIVRFFAAMAGAAMISNSPGSVSDVTEEKYRALAFSIWSIGPINGPVTGPLIGGFVAEYMGWRWTNWIALILAGFAFITCSCIKETYAPVILKRKAAKMRQDTGDDRWWSRYDNRHMTIIDIFKVNLSRPFVLAFTEPILWFWNGYVGIIYAILYLCFVAYPLIYGELRGWSLGFTGLAFCGIGVGTMIAIFTEPLARRIVNNHKKDPETGRVFPEASVSIVCVASLLCPIGQIWFSWTSTPITIHWIWPILAGIPFGAGNTLVFIYASNYLAGSYGIYSASALASNSVVRSLLGGTLPLAGSSMYKAMSPHWAGTFLGLVQVALIPIPFVFYKYGHRIRAKSPLIRQMREDQEKSQKRVAKSKRQQERHDAVRGDVVLNGGSDVENGAADKTTETNASEMV